MLMIVHSKQYFFFYRKTLSLQNLHNHIAANLKEVSEKEMKSSKDGPDFTIGRMGPTDCTFDISTSVGTLIVDPDKLGVCCYCYIQHCHLSNQQIIDLLVKEIMVL